jgi:hypothetical protein
MMSSIANTSKTSSARAWVRLLARQVIAAASMTAI